MPLPEPILDDLRFQQDLVDEARRRIIRYCPEWTDYNLSDPGITLIELFAWMTELIVYRLNRVPAKNFIKFMELIGLQLQSASSAQTELTFWLSAPFPLSPEDTTTALVPMGSEVSTLSTEEEPEVIFTTDHRLLIDSPVLAQLRRDPEFNKNYLPRLGIEPFYAFDEHEPKEGDLFYIGFDENIEMSGQVLRLSFKCEPVQAVGVRREDPPWIWECSTGNGQWEEVPPSKRHGEKDTTGGLNNPEGRVIFYLPLSMRPDQVNGRSAYWMRCRFDIRREEQGIYTESPRITGLQAHTLGRTVSATHAVFVYNEELGTSNGEPGQTFYLEHRPILSLREDETVEVEEKQHGEMVFVPWQIVSNFSQSSRYDRHYALDLATGEVRFGPAVRQQDGSVWQYGRVPEAGRRIRFTRYRYGGGVVGNVPTGKLQVLRSAIPYIDRVSNLTPAVGGRDQESLEEAKLRVPQELRAQQRAVTQDDYENLAKNASRTVARVKCNVPGSGPGAPPPGTIELLIVPAVPESLRVGDRTRLELSEELRATVQEHLDQYRLLTTNLVVREPNYIGVRVRAQIVVAEYSKPDVVRARVLERLHDLITPLPLGRNETLIAEFLGSAWHGWPFGRDLYIAELFSYIQQTPGVKHVLDVYLSHRPMIPSREPEPGVVIEDDEEWADRLALTALQGKFLDVSTDTLLCSLDHQVELMDL